ncbi:MAG: AAA family ATPase [Dehalococcoidales bacterium]|nr:MAG: AAA family ATPase [Dehalococcoidales bacterium]
MMWQMIGQDRAVSLLQRSLEMGALAHAYLFVGPAHVGKMTLAIKLAKALNCTAAEPPCGECLSCQKIASNKHADVQVIDLDHRGDLTEAESRVKIGVGQIEQVQHSASLPPFEGRYKVFIIDRADLLSIGAANRLLKTLEEPEDNTVFVLLTTSEQLLPLTVISRCQRVELYPVAINELEEILKSNWVSDPAKARLLTRLSRGCPGWALAAIHDERLLGQRDEYLDEIMSIAHADYDERFTYAGRLAAQFQQNRELVQERLGLWLGWWRDLLLVKAGSADDITNIDRLDTLVEMAGGYSLTQTRDFINSIRAAYQQLGQNANAQLVLEVLMLDLPVVGDRGGGRYAAQIEVKHG